MKKPEHIAQRGAGHDGLGLPYSVGGSRIYGSRLVDWAGQALDCPCVHGNRYFCFAACLY